jgi:isopentenyl diphosphate isomerase/L-lactate dehydrogenase-like FMN-dependent dehydrogenase
VASPFIAAPTALLAMAHPAAEAAVAAACAAAQTLMCVSTTSSCSLEDVAAAAPSGVRWFQLYVYKDRERTRRLVQRAAAAGYVALCLTVDLPVRPTRNKPTYRVRPNEPSKRTALVAFTHPASHQAMIESVEAHCLRSVLLAPESEFFPSAAQGFESLRAHGSMQVALLSAAIHPNQH